MRQQTIARYVSPLGEILLAAEEDGLCGLWFEGQKHYGTGLCPDVRQGRTAALTTAIRWLDAYFSGSTELPAVPLFLSGTPFQRAVWQQLLLIPYGQTVTYGTLAKRLAEARGMAGMSACAVGSAVGRNPVSLIVPCHRVTGADGRLTGYAGGLDRKAWLLTHEGQPKELAVEI